MMVGQKVIADIMEVLNRYRQLGGSESKFVNDIDNIEILSENDWDRLYTITFFEMTYNEQEYMVGILLKCPHATIHSRSTAAATFALSTDLNIRSRVKEIVCVDNGFDPETIGTVASIIAYMEKMEKIKEKELSQK